MPVSSRTVRLLVQPLSGYPDPYVSTRLTPRLARLEKSGTASCNGVNTWTSVRQAVQWSYRQLALPRRRQLLQHYLYFELPLLVTSIRFAAAGDRQRAANILTNSLWAPPLYKIVIGAPARSVLVKQLERHLELSGWPLPASQGDIDRHPLQALESRLYQGLLEMMSRCSPPAQLAESFSAIHDLFKLATIRTQNPSPLKVATEGRLSLAELQRPERLYHAIIRHYGKTVVSDAAPEQQLMHAYAATLLMRARQGDFLTRLLAFLWGHLACLDGSGEAAALHGREG